MKKKIRLVSDSITKDGGKSMYGVAMSIEIWDFTPEEGEILCEIFDHPKPLKDSIIIATIPIFMVPEETPWLDEFRRAVSDSEGVEQYKQILEQVEVKLIPVMEV